MPIVIDGNNLLHRLPRADRSRVAVRREVLDATRYEKVTVTVIFDGPPPSGTPARESLGRVTIVYSGSRPADDVIVDMLPDGGSAKQWSVITDDRGLADRVRARGASSRRLAEWQRRRTASPPQGRRVESKLSSREIADWEDYFSHRDSD